ncbi:hypothetical protein MFUM_720056 [Methylacidiphilum fumariolicum SolV]|uniref:Uncharacterized protein n=2 Tax=Candidatus Methylacidiphilum fumarolicum TaxID=591154 RepID=I0JZM0_METFB|nr:conserved protein of unknown function [Candidatus Methylacidiphilum fumarolicum]CCG92689.1 hypothetical protein MFUM_720056 [Methylacidiphilum fumariolicum SolV]
MRIASQYPCSGLLLLGREFGPVHPYDLIRAQATPFSQNNQSGIYVAIASPRTRTIECSV